MTAVAVEWPEPLTLPDAGSWRDHAACLGAVDVDWLFVHDGERIETAAKRLLPFARMHCRPCPVRLDCRAQPEHYGLWGGELRSADAARDLLVSVAPKQRRKERK